MASELSIKFDIPGDVKLDNAQTLMLTFIQKINANMDAQFKALNDKLDLESFKFAEIDMRLTEINTEITTQKQSTDELRSENTVLKHELECLKEKCIKLEGQSRRENLIFSGVTESTAENCHEKIKHILKNILKVEDDIPIERCHRLGNLGASSRKKPRNIIVKFSRFPDRQIVWNKSKTLRSIKHQIQVYEDFPPEILQRRNQLKPALNKAKAAGKTAYLIADRLVIDEQTYTVQTMNTLPAHFNPANLSTPQIAPGLVAFYGINSPLSNFHSAQFVIDGQLFHHVEQYYQYKRSKFFGDGPSASKIIASKSPYDCFFMGKNINMPQDDDTAGQWIDMQAIPTMQRGVAAKFQQNPRLAGFLLSTQGSDIVEANANDSFWGAGLSLNDEKLKNTSDWPGQNQLGQILMQVRDRLTIQKH